MAVGDTYVFPSFFTPELTQLSFQSHQLLFSQASSEIGCENMPERNFAYTRDRTHNYQVMSQIQPTQSRRAGQKKEKKIKPLQNRPLFLGVR